MEYIVSVLGADSREFETFAKAHEFVHTAAPHYIRGLPYWIYKKPETCVMYGYVP